MEVNVKLWMWHRALLWGGEGGELGVGLRWRQEGRAKWCRVVARVEAHRPGTRRHLRQAGVWVSPQVLAGQRSPAV